MKILIMKSKILWIISERTTCNSKYYITKIVLIDEDNLSALDSPQITWIEEDFFFFFLEVVYIH